MRRAGRRALQRPGKRWSRFSGGLQQASLATQPDLPYFLAMFANFFTRAKPEHKTELDLVHAGIAYKIHLKRSAAARRITLRVRTASRDIVMTMPARSSMALARDFAERHAGWIEARLRQLPQPVRFAPGQVIPLRGVEHLVVHRPSIRKPVWVEARTADGAGPSLLLCVSGEAEHAGRRIKDYLKREAKRDIEDAVRHHAGSIGKTAKTVTLRDTTSRWGSCSSKGALNFSWRLILAPGYVLDYLAAHEVAHLVHMDHSPRFWKLAGELAPQLDKAEAWLKAHGSSLHRYGA